MLTNVLGRPYNKIIHTIVWTHPAGASVRVVYMTECFIVQMNSNTDDGWVNVSLPMIDLTCAIAIANAYANDGQG